MLTLKVVLRLKTKTRCPLLAQSGGSPWRSNPVAVGGIADIIRRMAPTEGVAHDAKAKWRVTR